MYGYGSLPGAASGRINDRIREAEAYRRSRETAKGRALVSRARVRTAGRAVISAVLWPVKSLLRSGA